MVLLGTLSEIPLILIRFFKGGVQISVQIIARSLNSFHSFGKQVNRQTYPKQTQS